MFFKTDSLKLQIQNTENKIFKGANFPFSTNCNSSISSPVYFKSLWNTKISYKSISVVWTRSAKKLLLIFLLPTNQECRNVFFSTVAGWILQNIWERLFYRTPPSDCFWHCKWYEKNTDLNFPFEQTLYESWVK